MLQSLYIKNFVLIKELTLDFSQGFSVITGETGAGKSILLGALNLVLGARSDSKQISEGADKCIIEAVFNIEQYNLSDFFAENDLDYSHECVLRRELHASGKTRQFLNDTPVSASVLKALSALFIDIHSQHQNLLIKDSLFQLQVVDAYAQNATLLQNYQQAFKRYKTLTAQVKESMEAAAKGKEEADYWQFQFDQLEQARLQEGEMEQLEAENELLEHAGEIKSNLYYVEQALQADGGVLALLKDAESKIQAIRTYAEEYQQWAERLQSAYIELKDIAADTNRAANHTEDNPAQLQANQERLSTLYTLLQKHKVTSVSELIALREQLAERLAQVDHADDHIAALQKQQAEALQEATEWANQLHEKRLQAAAEIGPLLEKQLAALGMQQTTVLVQLTESEQLQAHGKDNAAFLYAPSKANTPQMAGKIASGGEISRLMLCIKALLAKSAHLPTLIFDEIDTGISGETASLMGQLLQSMSQTAQIICITHLPQIAALGHTHYFVYKNQEDALLTQVKQLLDEERVTAIAKMLSGTNITDAAIQNAQSLLLNRNWANLRLRRKW